MNGEKSGGKFRVQEVSISRTTCGPKSGTAHAFSINVMRTYVNDTGHWKYPELVKTHYSKHHHSGTKGTWVRNFGI